MSFINDIMDKGKEFMEDQVEKGLNFIGQDGESSFNYFHPALSVKQMWSRHRQQICNEFAYHIKSKSSSLLIVGFSPSK